MPRQQISIVGPGRLGRSLARALKRAGYTIAEIVYREGASARHAKSLAKELRAEPLLYPQQYAPVVLLCVGDSQLGAVSQELANWPWQGRVALHTSGAMTSDVLALLRDKGAAIGSMHPMMSFVQGVTTPLKGVSFALEGDAKALRVARAMVRDVGGRSFVLEKAAKPLYHAFGAFASPLLIATFAAGEKVARKAGLRQAQARAAMGPIIEQTVNNYLQKGTAGAFSGPLIRGDVDTVRKHLDVLRALPEVREAYIALVRCALEALPVKNAGGIAELLPRSGQ